MAVRQAIATQSLSGRLRMLTRVALVIGAPLLLLSLFSTSLATPFAGQAWGFWVVAGLALVTLLVALGASRRAP